MSPTVSSPSDYDTAPDVLEPVDAAALRSDMLVLCSIIADFRAHTLIDTEPTLLLFTVKYQQESRSSR